MSEEGSSRGEIFIVDDDPAVRGTLSVILSRNGYEVACYAEGESLLAAARSPACILSRVCLHGRSGVDMLKELHAEECAVAILVISVTGVTPMAVAAIKRAALDVIGDPVRANAVSTAVEDAVGAWSSRPSNKVV